METLKNIFKVKKFAASIEEAKPSYQLYLISLGAVVFLLSHNQWLSIIGGASILLGLALLSVRELIGGNLKGEIDDYIETKYGDALRKKGAARIGVYVNTEEPHQLTLARKYFLNGSVDKNTLQSVNASICVVDKDNRINEIHFDKKFQPTRVPYINIFVKTDSVSVLGSKSILHDFTDWELRRYIDTSITTFLQQHE
jgi:hypothetical protein